MKEVFIDLEYYTNESNNINYPEVIFPIDETEDSQYVLEVIDDEDLIF